MIGRLRSAATELTIGLLGSTTVSWAARRATRHQLRVLAFHDVQDGAAFERTLDVIDEHHRTVGSTEVSAWLAGRDALPDGAVWITFDDGHPEVVSVALPLLRARGMTATVFVVGGLVDTDRAPWWDVARSAGDHRLIGCDDLGTSGPDTPSSVPTAEFMRWMKDAPDGERRRLLDVATRRLADVDASVVRQQLSTADLRRWQDAGCEVGNHSWDHPCLDRCDADEQRRQVRLAHDALCTATGRQVDVFAWPNGDAAPAAADELRRLGYRLVAGFDHRLCPSNADPHAVSRLRLDTDAPQRRARSILSGAHPFLYHQVGRVRATGIRSDGP